MKDVKIEKYKFEEHKIDIESNLRIYLPSMFELLGPERISWSTVSKNFHEKLLERVASYRASPDGKFMIETTLFDVITQLLRGNMHYLGLFRFINNMIFKDLIELMNVDEKKLIKKTLYNLVTEFSKDYRNYVGELAILWKYKKSGYTLAAIEMLVDDSKPDGKNFDFVFTKGKTYQYIEVVNIQLSDKNTLNDYFIKRTITSKIERKLLTIQSDSKEIWLHVVVWGDFEQIKKVNEWWDSNNISFHRTVKPNAFMSYIANTGEEVVRFGPLHKLLDLKSIE